MIRPVELDLVGPGAVAEREIAGGERGLAAVLAVQAPPIYLQVEEEHRCAGARDVQSRMPDQLRLGEHLSDGQFADPAP